MAHVGQRGVAAKKPHHHVGVFSLRLDIGFDIGTPSLEFGEHLLPGVSAFYDVALNFPLNAQLFFRVEPDLEVESVRIAGTRKGCKPCTRTTSRGWTISGPLIVPSRWS